MADENPIKKIIEALFRGPPQEQLEEAQAQSTRCMKRSRDVASLLENEDIDNRLIISGLAYVQALRAKLEQDEAIQELLKNPKLVQMANDQISAQLQQLVGLQAQIMLAMLLTAEKVEGR
jgi:hypothetical protein